MSALSQYFPAMKAEYILVRGGRAQLIPSVEADGNRHWRIWGCGGGDGGGARDGRPEGTNSLNFTQFLVIFDTIVC